MPRAALKDASSQLNKRSVAKVADSEKPKPAKRARKAGSQKGETGDSAEPTTSKPKKTKNTKSSENKVQKSSATNPPQFWTHVILDGEEEVHTPLPPFL